VNYEDDYAKTVGSISAKAPTVAAFGTLATEVMGDAALAATPTAKRSRASSGARTRTARSTIVTFSRKNVRISSYRDDAIHTRVETWADGIVALE